MTEPPLTHRQLAVDYFNAAWALIDSSDRSPQDDAAMLGLAFASRQHWIAAGGTAENLAVSDWQVAHVASLLGFADLALAFARFTVDRVEAASFPLWQQASAHEGMARAHAAAGDHEGYQREVDLARSLLADVTDDEDRALIERQLASINPPVT